MANQQTPEKAIIRLTVLEMDKKNNGAGLTKTHKKERTKKKQLKHHQQQHQQQ